MKKRILSLMLALCLLCCILPQGMITMSAAATSGTCGNGLNWSFNSVTNILTISGTGDMNDCTSGSAAPWEEWKTDITVVQIGEGVTGIGRYAFSNCTELVRVILPDSLRSIRTYAFSGCSSLAVASLPEGLTDIYDYAFLNCTSLTDMVLPEGITAVEGGLFEGCTNLKRVTIPDGVTSIGWGAFSGCSSLQELLLPDTVTSIENYAFKNCGNLTEIKIPAAVATIGGYAFQNCTGLTRMELPAELSAIEESLFDGCSKLAWVTIPYGIKTIGKHAFQNCTGLKRVTVPLSVSTINEGAFKGCENLERLVLRTPGCTIYNSKYTLGVRGKTTIYGYLGYGPETYAEKYGFTFYELPTEVEIGINHTLNLASDISMNYAVKTELLDDYDSYTMEVIVPEYTGNLWTNYKIVELTPVLNGNYYYFTLDGLTAIQMNDVVEATLYLQKDGVDYASQTDSYSIATYAYNQLGKASASRELMMKMCADLLQYGAKAQSYKGYRTDALADAAMMQAHKAYLTDLSAVSFNNHNKILEDVENPSMVWVGKTLSLESKVVVRFIADPSAFTGNWRDVSLHVSYVDSEGNTVTVKSRDFRDVNQEGAENWCAFDFAELRAAELRTVLSAAVYEGDVQVSPTIEYSVDTYCNGKTGALGDLCRAMIAYSDSALAYFTK